MEKERRFSFVAWLIFAVALAAVLCLGLGGCNEEVCGPAAWLMTGPDLDDETNEIIGRIGIANTDGVEFGLESTWYGIKGAEQAYGAYAVQDVNVLPIGTQYIGAHAGIIDVDQSGNVYGFISGEKVPISKNIDAVVEGQFNSLDGAIAEQAGTDDDWRIFAGLRMKF